MKKCLLAAMVLGATVTAHAQQHQLVKKWETDTLKVPESVLYDEAGKVLYVTNIDGQPWEKDFKGSVGKIGLDGKIIAVDWVTGLHAPKGMGLYKGKLYVADVDYVAVIDVAKNALVDRINIEGATGLNDLDIDSKGNVFVSDSKMKRIHRIENGHVTVVADSLKGPNGVHLFKDELFILDNGILYKVGKEKSLTKIAEGLEGGSDGLEAVNNTDFIVSCWSGVIWYVKGDGSKEQLLDTRTQKINSADIGYDAAKRIVYVPTFWKNSVVAYELK